MSLYAEFLNNSDKQCYKWVHYFPIYENHISRFRNQSALIIEIGVFRGGSLPIWKKYLGPLCTVVGIDIDEKCKAYEDNECHIRIGDQTDTQFLGSILTEFGNPDIIIDDGGHKQSQMNKSFEFLYPKLNNNGVYIVEDTHACYWPEYEGGLHKSNTFIEKSKLMVDQLNEYHYLKPDKLSYINQHTWSITFYDSVVVFEKKRKQKPYAIITPA